MSQQEIAMEKNTCFNSLTLLVLKEVRLEKGIQSGQIAEQIGKSPSAWAKIESGKSAFSMDSLFQVSRALWVPASVIISAAERYHSIISQHGWYVMNTDLPADEDNLLLKAQDYYNSPGFKRRFQPVFGHTIFNGFGISVLNSPINNPNGTVSIIDLFRFIVDSNFESEQKAENPPLLRMPTI